MSRNRKPAAHLKRLEKRNAKQQRQRRNEQKRLNRTAGALTGRSSAQRTIGRKGSSNQQIAPQAPYSAGILQLVKKSWQAPKPDEKVIPFKVNHFSRKSKLVAQEQAS